MTIEDEKGKANLVVFKNLFEKFRKEIHSKLVMAEGTLQKEGEVINVVVKRLTNLTSLLNDLTRRQNDDLALLSLSHADEGARLNISATDRRCQIRKDPAEPPFPAARNFR